MTAGDLEFALLVERGPLEAQAVLLCESIRHFAGRHRDSKISVISPRPGWRPSDATKDRLTRFGADYIALDLESPVADYGSSYKVLGLGWLAREAGPPVLVQLDSDTVFLDEPDFPLGDAPAAARPEDTVGMCSTGPNDYRERHWAAMCRINGVDVAELPWVTAPVDDRLIRASYNGGLVVAPRSFFADVERCFLAIANAGLRSYPDRLNGIRIGAGRVSARGYSMWGTSQAAISIAAARSGRPVRELGGSYNFPLHFLDRLRMSAERPIHVHYHWLFNDQDLPDAALDRLLRHMPGQRDWLKARLPLPLRIVEGQGVFSPAPAPAARPAVRGSDPTPRCSIVMPVFNDVRFLRQAVESVIAQTFAEWELIIVDDGSDVPAAIADLVSLDARIRTIRSDSNLGIAAALNLGIAESRGEIIARLDSDDIAEPERLARQIEALDSDPELGDGTSASWAA